MKYKIGDKVILKENLGEKTTQGTSFIISMEKFKPLVGKVCTVHKVYESEHKNLYLIAHNNPHGPPTTRWAYEWRLMKL